LTLDNQISDIKMDKPVIKNSSHNSQVEVIYFLSHPIQYFSPLLKELDKVTGLEVYYYSDASLKTGVDSGFGKKISWDIPLLEGYKYTFLKNYRRNRGLNSRFLDVWNPGVWNVVRKSKARIVWVNDWTYSSTWLVLLAAKFFGKEVWLRADNPANQELNKSRKLLLIKKMIFKHFLLRFFVDKCLNTGKQSRLFFNFYGVHDERQIYTPHAVDNNYFRRSALGNYGQVLAFKQRLGIPKEKKVILFAGKYIPKKRPIDLLQAFIDLKSDNYYLVLVGEGELRPEMEQLIQSHDLKNVLLTGFINQSEIPSYYSIADVFVMCSGAGETWGLAVNEAMNFAKPIIISDTCGCSVDLVKHGENGFIFKEGNKEQLAAYLQKTLDDEAFCKKAGQKSVDIIDTFSIGHIVENIKRALKLNKKL
jgi:glycosyltransferase involved in cell wall biosynthesis